jgi:putative component of toxin-antitoxin plasmid stabilization module
MTFNRTRDALKKAFPDIYVSVRLTNIRKENCGDTRRTDKGFLVRIQKGQPLQVLLDTLVHEFAHCLAFDEWEKTQTHGPKWGVALSECYRVYESIVTANKTKCHES